MKPSLNGRVVAITGAARGIGYATAAELTRRGAKVAIGDIDEAVLKQSATTLGLDVYGHLNVADPQSFENFLADVERRLGPLDVLINNAGIMPAGRLIDETDALTRRIIDINVMGVITGSKLAARRMVPRGRGHVVNVASLAGETYAPGLATYCASKYAVVGFTDAARVEYRSSGVNFSLVMPSFVNTELTAGTAGLPGMRNAEPEEIASAIADLLVKPRPRIRVRRIPGALSASQKFLPHALAERLGRALGGEEIFLGNVDADKRRAYEDRARGL